MVDEAERVGFLGEAWVAHRVAAAFVDRDRPRHLAAIDALQRRFEAR